MATIFRLGTRKILDQILRHEKIGMTSLVRPITLKPIPAAPSKEMGYDERNMKLGRPQSPSMTVYAFPLTSMLSISHRATGMVLAGYTIMFGLGAVVLPESIEFYLKQLENSDVSITLLTGAKFMLAFPLTYHFWNGIRHLCWDLGLFLTMKEVYITGYAMLLAAIGSAIALTQI